MIIAIVDFKTSAADRAVALAHLDGERREVSAMPGNVSYRVYASRDDDTLVTLIHEWDDEESFDAYRNSGSFARSGKVIRPLMDGPPMSRRFRAQPYEDIA